MLGVVCLFVCIYVMFVWAMLPESNKHNTIQCCNIKLLHRIHTAGQKSNIVSFLVVYQQCLQCFDAVGWVAGRASSP